MCTGSVCDIVVVFADLNTMSCCLLHTLCVSWWQAFWYMVLKLVKQIIIHSLTCYMLWWSQLCTCICTCNFAACWTVVSVLLVIAANCTLSGENGYKISGEQRSTAHTQLLDKCTLSKSMWQIHTKPYFSGEPVCQFFSSWTFFVYYLLYIHLYMYLYNVAKHNFWPLSPLIVGQGCSYTFTSETVKMHQVAEFCQSELDFSSQVYCAAYLESPCNSFICTCANSCLIDHIHMKIVYKRQHWNSSRICACA